MEKHDSAGINFLVVGRGTTAVGPAVPDAVS